MHNAIFGSINFNDPLLEFFKFQFDRDRQEGENDAPIPSNRWNQR